LGVRLGEFRELSFHIPCTLTSDVNALGVKVKSYHFIPLLTMLRLPPVLVDVSPNFPRDTDDIGEGGFKVIDHTRDKARDIGEVPLQGIH
jgi:hypothetical protein